MLSIAKPVAVVVVVVVVVGIVGARTGGIRHTSPCQRLHKCDPAHSPCLNLNVVDLVLLPIVGNSFVEPVVLRKLLFSSNWSASTMLSMLFVEPAVRLKAVDAAAAADFGDILAPVSAATPMTSALDDTFRIFVFPVFFLARNLPPLPCLRSTAGALLLSPEVEDDDALDIRLAIPTARCLVLLSAAI